MRNAGFWWRLIHLDPAVYRGFIVATAALLVGLGLTFGADLPENLVVLIGAVFALAQGLWTRGAVTANDKVLAYLPDPVDMPNGVAAGPAVTGASNEKIIEAARSRSTDGGTV